LTNSTIYIILKGLSICLPKEGKDKHAMINWGPITLLCGDFKLASSCIANKLKPMLQNIIGEIKKDS